MRVSPITRLITKNGTSGTSRSVNRYHAPSFSTPLLISARRLPKRASILWRSTKRALRKASVAPTLAANETISVPQPSPKMAPPASVKIAAPGMDSAVVAT